MIRTLKLAVRMSSGATPASSMTSMIAVASAVASCWASTRVGRSTSIPTTMVARSGGIRTEPKPLTKTMVAPGVGGGSS
jgi:hypothetical protein